MEVKVTGADDSDLAGGKKLLEPLRGLFPRLSLLSSIVCMVAYPGLSWRDIFIFADVPIGISSCESTRWFLPCYAYGGHMRDANLENLFHTTHAEESLQRQRSFIFSLSCGFIRHLNTL